MQPFPYKSLPEPLQGVGKLPPPQSHVTEEAWGGGICPSPHQALRGTPLPQVFYLFKLFLHK